MAWPDLHALPLVINLMLFALGAAAIWNAGSRLSAYADAIAERRQIGKAMMGFVFLAAATELPEMVTTFTAAVTGNAVLVLNNMFGGITMQTAILAAADVVAARAALTFYPRKPTPALEAALIILLLTFLIGIAAMGDIAVVWHVGAGSIVLAAAYGFSVRLLRSYDDNSDWVPVEMPDEPEHEGRAETALTGLDVPALIRRFAAASAVILVCGVVLVRLTETIAVQSGLGQSFLGVTLLAASTSLPELSTTIAAVRLGAYTMAISNIFGSNLIMLALLLPADMLYRDGPILSMVDGSAGFALVSGVLVTAIYLIGLLIRRKRKLLGMGIDSALVVAVYAASLVVFYTLR